MSAEKEKRLRNFELFITIIQESNNVVDHDEDRDFLIRELKYILGENEFYEPNNIPFLLQLGYIFAQLNKDQMSEILDICITKASKNIVDDFSGFEQSLIRLAIAAGVYRAGRKHSNLINDYFCFAMFEITRLSVIAMDMLSNVKKALINLIPDAHFIFKYDPQVWVESGLFSDDTEKVLIGINEWLNSARDGDAFDEIQACLQSAGLNGKEFGDFLRKLEKAVPRRFHY